MDKNLPDDPVRKLVEIMKRLRGPQGCPWDQLQTPQTLKPYLLEEAHEVLHAIDNEGPDEIKNELGDLLLQVVFLAGTYEENRLFSIDDVA
ncbi:MAG: nucleoside triphosphate pyrophosphohydrolase, partial [Phycisphaerae bacterium]|nr:nucleoside triphosphate pyrophosphohydrolase [Phycisphaerae bacterium]NIX29228.1 nucleoside triphosphate pyrophosphohydrolase [Phycisphaerae bacterium]